MEIAFLFGLAKDKRFIYILHVVLDFIIGSADDGLEAQIPDQLDTACHLFRIHFREGLV